MEHKEEENETVLEDTEVKDDRKHNIRKLISTMQPAILFENLFGIFRFRLTDAEVVAANGKMRILTILLTSTYILLFFSFLKLPAAITGTAKLVDIVDEMPSLVALIQYVLSAIRTSFFLNERNIHIITTLADLDYKLHVSTNQDFYKKTHGTTKKIMFVLIFIHLLVSLTDLMTDDYITVSNVIVFPIYLQQSLEICVFCIMILMLMRRLNVINNYLTKFINEKDNSKSSVFIVTEKKAAPEEFNLIGRSSSENMKIRDLAVTYDIIGETCDLINDVFNFQIFMSLVATFTFIVITIWSSLYYYRTSGDNNVSLATIIIWCITDIFIVAFMSLTCEKLLLTRTDTKILVNKIIMDYDLPKIMRVQAKAFMELIEAWPLRIFIYDMFSVDITLMLKYISVATTYLIVIIQISHFV